MKLILNSFASKKREISKTKILAITGSAENLIKKYDQRFVTNLWGNNKFT